VVREVINRETVTGIDHQVEVQEVIHTQVMKAEVEEEVEGINIDIDQEEATVVEVANLGNQVDPQVRERGV
jgi:hypothetical protein